MKKYALIIDENTKLCQVGIGSKTAIYKSIGMIEMEVEQASDGNWYVAGCVPRICYANLRRAAYPSVKEQLDMIYWDKINGTSKWQACINAVKAKYPKI